MTDRREAVDIDSVLAVLWAIHERNLSWAVSTKESLSRTQSLYMTADLEKHLAGYRVTIAECQAEEAPLVAAYRADPWPRFFLVMIGNGHVHASMECVTCFPTTQFAWLPALSGASEDEAVLEYGESMCTVCFPSAPTSTAYQEAVAARIARDATAEGARCVGSLTRDHDSSHVNYYSPRATCDHCGQIVSVTSTGKLRRHDRPKVSA